MTHWPGPLQAQAWEVYRLCLSEGMPTKRAIAVAAICSFRDGWIFRESVAEFAGCCIRTVQRGISQAVLLGILGRARAKKREIPPGMDRPLKCGWSHRWLIGAGMDAVHAIAARSAARMTQIARTAARSTKSLGTAVRARARMTADQLDAALALLPRLWHPPPNK